eukprot:1158397-Pelagomonas_calceolata.AAC.6
MEGTYSEQGDFMPVPVPAARWHGWHIRERLEQVQALVHSLNRSGSHLLQYKAPECSVALGACGVGSPLVETHIQGYLLPAPWLSCPFTRFLHAVKPRFQFVKSATYMPLSRPQGTLMPHCPATISMQMESGNGAAGLGQEAPLDQDPTVQPQAAGAGLG